ncbi:MAG: TlpA family protein disulfide reductase [Flavobacteriia bacterium]|nr:TlpA family protein disulfide reductase [Flavobacteriia bacterium]
MVRVGKILAWSLFGLGLAFLRNLTFLLHFYGGVLLIYVALGILAGLTLKKGTASQKAMVVGLSVGLIFFLMPWELSVKYTDVIGLSCYALGVITCLKLTSLRHRALTVLIVFIAGYASITYLRISEITFHGGSEKNETAAYAFVDGTFKSFPRDNGKVKVVELWFKNCVPCVKALPEFQLLREEYKNNPNVEFLTINVGVDSDSAILHVLNRLDLDLPVALDNDRFIRELKPSKFYPSTMIFSKENRLILESVGYLKEFKWLRSWQVRRTIESEINKVAE